MAGVISDDMCKEMKFCANCFVFNWKQPTTNLLKRCKECRMVWYCDDKCQKEHWYNTHKKQCKYVSNKKLLRNDRHEESTCLVCKDEARIGKDEMSKESNPILPCIMSRANRELMNINDSFEGFSFIALAEMTGIFHTKVEALVVSFMRILVKMKMTKHSLWQGRRTAALAEEMYKVLWKERIAHLFWAFTFKKPGTLEGQLEFDHINSRVSKVIAEKMGEIATIRRAAESRGIIAGDESPSLFKPWKTLEVLTHLLFVLHAVIMAQNAADCLGTDGVPEEIGVIRTTSAQSDKMRDNVLNLLSGRLVPYTSLVVDGLCDGNPVQQCYVCKEEVTVRKAAVGIVSPTVPGDDPAIVLGQIVTFSRCGRETCKENATKFISKGYLKELWELYIRLGGEHLQELCDYCGKFNYKARGLRCAGCLTKLYCGVECQVKDTYHLQVKCEKGDKRKKKRSDSSRKEEGVKFVQKRLGDGGVNAL